MADTCRHAAVMFGAFGMQRNRRGGMQSSAGGAVRISLTTVREDASHAAPMRQSASTPAESNRRLPAATQP